MGASNNAAANPRPRWPDIAHPQSPTRRTLRWCAAQLV